MTQYTRTAMFLHWMAAATIFAMLFTAFRAWSSSSQENELYWLHLHGSIGAAFAVVIAARIIYHFSTTQPPTLTNKAWESSLSRFVHKAMLSLVALQFITGPIDIWSGGWPIDVFGWFEIPPPFAKWSDASHGVIGTVHRLAGMAVLLLVVLHIAAALKHHWIDRDQTLRRMLRLQQQ